MLRQYFVVGAIILCFMVLLNIIVLVYVRTLPMIAVANAVAVFCWYLVNELQLKNSIQQTYPLILKTLCAVLLYLSGFWIVLLSVHAVPLQIVFYGSSFIGISMLFFKRELIQLKEMRKHFVRKPAEIVIDSTEPPIP
jgi:hypothetical protein